MENIDNEHLNKKSKKTIPVFVLNLPNRKDRKVFMEDQFTRLKLKPIFVNAINGKEVIFNIDVNLYDERKSIIKNGKSLSEGELGCALSHVSIYKKIVEEHIPIALICEDDIELSPKIISLLKTVAETDHDWEWLQIDYIAGSEFLRERVTQMKDIVKRSIGKGIVSFIKLFLIIPIIVYEIIQTKNTIYNNRYSIGKVFRPLYLASCYMITFEGARKLLSVNDPIVFPADRAQNQARKRKGLIMRMVYPQLAHQMRAEFKSDIAQ